MKAIVCEMCGSQDLVKQDGYYVCQNCGTKYDPEEAKKLMVEVTGSVKVDNTGKLKNYYQLARRAIEENNADDAAKYYGLIKEENPNDWEAHFYCLVAKALQNKSFYAVESSLKPVADSMTSVLMNIKNTVDSNEREAVLSTVYNAVVKNMAESIHSDAYQWYENNRKRQDNCLQVYRNVLNATSYLALCTGDAFETVFGVEAKTFFLSAWKTSIKILENSSNTMLNHSIPKNYADAISIVESKIQKYESNYSKPSVASASSGGGCYVATAVYGSYDCPQVWTLRRYRDFTLAESWLGRLFIFLYYAISPTLVRWFGETRWFKNMWKPKLDRMVKRLNEEGVADTRYQDRQW